MDLGGMELSSRKKDANSENPGSNIMERPGSQLPKGYYEFLGYLKEKIRSAQIKAVISVNSELILLYWEIGMDILTRQREERWGTKVIERLALDLKNEFPNMNGFSVRNLKYMRAFAEANPKKTIVQQLAAQIPWFHNCVLMDKIKDPAERIWYAQKTVENGWSRAVLVHQIEISNRTEKEELRKERTWCGLRCHPYAPARRIAVTRPSSMARPTPRLACSSGLIHEIAFRN